MSDNVRPTLEDLTECWCGYQAAGMGDLFSHQLNCDPHNTSPKVIDDQRKRIATLEAQLAAAQERERGLREICSGIVQREWDAYLTENGAFLPACDYCRSARTYGHTVDCPIGRLVAALAAAQPASDGQDGK